MAWTLLAAGQGMRHTVGHSSCLVYEVDGAAIGGNEGSNRI